MFLTLKTNEKCGFCVPFCFARRYSRSAIKIKKLFFYFVLFSLIRTFAG